MQVADEMREHEQRLFLINDGKRRRRGPVEKDRHSCINGGNNIVVIRACKVPIEPVSLYRDVIEMIRVVAAAILAACDVAATVPISFRIVLHPRSLQFERRARGLKLRVFLINERAVRLLFHALDAVKPRRGGAEIKSEYLCDSLFRVGVEQLICDRTDDLVSWRIPG